MNKKSFRRQFYESVSAIEVVGATYVPSMLKKGTNFFQLISTLFSVVKRGFVEL
jgi:hypothetical protein